MLEDPMVIGLLFLGVLIVAVWGFSEYVLQPPLSQRLKESKTTRSHSNPSKRVRYRNGYKVPKQRQ